MTYASDYVFFYLEPKYQKDLGEKVPSTSFTSHSPPSSPSTALIKQGGPVAALLSPH